MFVPHEGNNHHPHFWRRNSAVVVLALVLVVEMAVFTQSFLVFNKKTYLASVLPSGLETLTNNQRVSNNAAPLTENRLLVAAAGLKASDMAQRGYFAHNTPEGYLPWYWLEMVGYKYSHAGENLAVNYSDSIDVVNAWMNSPNHRANIVKQLYTETGIGLAQGIYEGRPTIFVTQFFGTPVAAATEEVKKTVKVETKNSTKVSVAKPAPAPAPAPGTASTSTPEPVLVKKVPIVIPIAEIATSSEQVAGAEVGNDSTTTKGVNFIDSILASPRHVGAYVFSVILGLILAAFLLILIVNKKIHHRKIVIMAVTAVVIIIGLLIFNNYFFQPRIIVEGGGAVYLEDSKI